MSVIQGNALIKQNGGNNPPRTAPPEPTRIWDFGKNRIPLLAALLLTVSAAHAQFGTQPVGALSGALTVTVTAQAPGAVKTVEVLTLGAPGLEFAQGSGGSNCAGTTFSATGQTCIESVTFTPMVPGLRTGAVVLLDINGSPLATSYVSGIGSGGLGVLVTGNMLPVAGNGTYEGSPGDGNPATTAELNQPSGMILDGAGNMYITDSLNNRIRMVCASAASATIKGTACTGAGIISTIAGSATPAYTGDNGPASAATLSNPSGIAIDGAGNLYIADTGNSAIRKISAASGTITTVAGGGTGCPGQTNAFGDGCPATSAPLNQPTGVTLDASGNFYIGDTNNHLIRLVSAATGMITTVAGSGYMKPNRDGGYSGDNGPAGNAELNLPFEVAFDAAGNMYIPDSANNRVREVAAVGGAITASSLITTFAGNGVPSYLGDGGAANKAELWAPSAVVIDAAGNVYIADTQNNAIRKVSAATSLISSLVQNGAGTYYTPGVGFSPISLNGPTGLSLDGKGNLFIADTINMVVREVQGNVAALNYTATPVRQGSKSAPQPQTVENDGNVAFDLTAIVPDANSALDSLTTTCTTGDPFLTVDGDCTIGAVFAPSVAVDPLTAIIDVGKAGDAADSPLEILLVGDATAVNSTTIALASTPNPSGFGQNVNFTATVTTGAGTGSLIGTVTFFDGTTTLSANVSVGATTTTGTSSTALATFPTAALAVGPHSITVSYNNANDPSHSTSTSAILIQTVLEATATALTSSLNPSLVGQNATFTATVTATAGGGVPPDGNIIFYDGATILGPVALNASGVAAWSTATLTGGAHSITASYGGDAAKDIQPSTSAALIQDVQTASTIAVVSSLNPSNYGSPVTFTATITPGGAAVVTGTVNFLDGGVKIGTGMLAGSPATATFTTSTLDVATHSITATYAGDANNAASNSAPLSQVVNQAQTATTAGASPNPGIAGLPEAITATVKPIAGASTPTGVVTFTNGTTTLGTASLGAGGTATFNAKLPPGQYSIVAAYAGDANDGASTSSEFSLAVLQAATQTSVTATPISSIVGGTVTFTAKVTGNGGIPTGNVTFNANGTPIGSAATLDATGTATITYAGLVPGSYTITAVYSGDANDSGSTGTGEAQFVVATIATSTSLSSSTTAGQGTQVVLVATVLAATGTAPTGTVTFNNGTTAVGTATLDSNGVATLIPNLVSGKYSIVAVYSGDATHSPSTSQPVSISGMGGGFNVSVTPGTVTMKTSQNATVTVTLSSSAGFADTIGLGCASLPAGVSCHFSPISVSLPANGTATDQLTIDTNNPLGGGSSAMNAHGNSRGTYLAGFLLPFSLLFGCIFLRFRKRHTGLLTMMLVVALSVATLFATGCNGFSMGSTAPGTYVIQITGTGSTSSTIHYQNVTLDITN